MTHDSFFDNAQQNGDVLLIGKEKVWQAERLINGCQYCEPANAMIPFDWVLGYITLSSPRATHYLLERLAICPHCTRPVNEKTLVVFWN